MLIKKIILSTSVTFLLFTPLMIATVSATFPSPPPDGALSYALDFTGGSTAYGWYGSDRVKELTYVLFYTFFKSGIEPDCIDLITDDECEVIL